MRPDDIPGVVAIESQVSDRPWSAALFEAELGQDDRRYFTAHSGGPAPQELLGFAGVMLAVDEAHITTVAVAPVVQRRRVGTRLMGALMVSAIELGAVAATLEVRAANLAAQRLYGTFGFAPVGVRPGYYSASGEDAIIMWAHDITTSDYQQRLQSRQEGLAELVGEDAR
ncbi:MAG: ribosomal protein S18-alanine N-acetyltransferase [Euzebya sp.]